MLMYSSDSHSFVGSVRLQDRSRVETSMDYDVYMSIMNIENTAF